MNRMVYDALQLAGLGLLSAGTWALWGWGAAAVTIGAALIVVPMLELTLFRRA